MKFPVFLIRDVYPGSWIPDPNFFHPRSRIKIFCLLDPWSRIWIFSILYPGSQKHIKEFKYLNKKKGFSALRNIIRVFDPGSGSQIWILTFYLSQILILDPRSRIQGSKRHRIRICNIGEFGFAQAVGGSVGYWLSTGAAVLTTHSMDQLSEAFRCKKEFSVYSIFTLSLSFLPFLSYDALRICFLTHLLRVCFLLFLSAAFKMQTKNKYFNVFFAYYVSKVHCYNFSKIESPKEVTKQYKFRFFFLSLLDDGRIRICTIMTDPDGL